MILRSENYLKEQEEKKCILSVMSILKWNMKCKIMCKSSSQYNLTHG